MELKLDAYLKLDVYDVSRDADKCEALRSTARWNRTGLSALEQDWTF